MSTYKALTQAELDAIYAHSDAVKAALWTQLKALRFRRCANLMQRANLSVTAVGHKDGIIAVLRVGSEIRCRWLLVDEDDVETFVVETFVELLEGVA